VRAVRIGGKLRKVLKRGRLPSYLHSARKPVCTTLFTPRTGALCAL